ncbi:tape measure protein [Leuconostoc lactis]|uniref:phage tail protein n=1 Tax=Leuconostoc lactis TaxID=1246 RepID=UPI001C1FF2EE|nr:tape measure protein [Leuconostoc lactis]MBU7536985.1 tape measure protein [Leuconostoc lactis]
MAGSRIKGITIEIDGDTKGLDKALGNVNQSASKTQQELRDVNKLLKLDPGNTDLIAQKQKLLAQAISQTSDKLGVLKSAQSQVEAQFKSGDIGEEQYRAFQREVAATEASLKGYKSQLSTAQSSQQELGNSTKRLQTFFKATGTEIDDFKGVLGTGLVNAIKNGTASSQAMDKALQVMAKEAGITSSDMGKLTKAIDSVDDGKAGISDVSKEIQTLSKSAEGAGGKLGTFREKLKFGVVAGAASKLATTAMGAVTGSIDDAVKRVDTLNAFPKVLQNFGFSASDAKNATAQMAKSIEGLPTTMDQAVSAVQGYVGATGNLDQSVQLFQATNDAAMVFAQGSTAAVDQFSMAYQQSLAAGKVEAENFNSMNESMPGLMNKVASSMGVSLSSLKSGLSDGSISVDDFNKAFVNLDKNGGAGMQALSKSAQDSSGGIATSMQNVKTEIVKTMASLIEAVGSENIKNAFKAIQDAIKAIVDFVKQNSSWLVPLVAGIGGLIVAIEAIKLIIAGFMLIFSPIGLAVMAVVAVIAIVVLAIKNWGAIVTWLKGVWQAIADFFSILWAAISEVFTNTLTAIGDFITTKFNQIKDIISTVWNAISSVISTVVNAIASVISSVWDTIVSVTTSVFNTVANVISSVWNNIKSVVSSVVNGVVSAVSGAWNTVVSVTSSVFNSVKSVASSVWNSIKSTISSVVNGISSTVSSVWNGIRSVTTSVWNGIKSAMTGPIEAAKGVISGIVNTIKGLFNFHLSFPAISIPHIPLPHFSLEGSFNPLKGQIPHVGVNWYAKGGIFTKPTMFAAPGGYNGVGEAGPEAALPLNAKTLGGIGKGIAEATGGLGGDTYQITIQVLADTSAQTIKKITDAVSDGITRAQNSKARALGGS